jgi:hypothetical protein
MLDAVRYDTKDLGNSASFKHAGMEHGLVVARPTEVKEDV